MIAVFCRSLESHSFSKRGLPARAQTVCWSVGRKRQVGKALNVRTMPTHCKQVTKLKSMYRELGPRLECLSTARLASRNPRQVIDRCDLNFMVYPQQVSCSSSLRSVPFSVIVFSRARAVEGSILTKTAVCQKLWRGLHTVKVNCPQT